MTICERLRHAITTASNDDYREAGADKRKRHVDRIDAMSDAIVEIERLRAALKPLAEIALWRDTYPDAKFNSMPSHMDGYLSIEDILKAREALGYEQAAPAKDRG